jgi:multidrug transporter EmrE-like cation transporter
MGKPTEAYLILAAAILLNASANVLIKIGMLKVGQGPNLKGVLFRAAVQPAVLFGIICFGLALAAYSLVLSRLSLSIAYPVNVSLGLIIVVISSYFLLNESITFVQILGFILIISGVYLVAR